MSRVTIVTDTWHPQINGAVTTLANSIIHLERQGHAVHVLEPSQFPSRPCPTYPEIRLARTHASDMSRLIEGSRPDYVLVATEGPLGLAARRALIRNDMPFATAFFTRFHDYLWLRFGLPRSLTLRWLDWFHRPAGVVLTPTPAMQRMLQARGLVRARAWMPGVDTSRFRRALGEASKLLDGLPRPIHLYVGRLAVEKNIDAFLSLDLEGSKVLVGDGPSMPRLRRRYPHAHFLGYRTAGEIAEICSASDVLVFPSRTDTFGHVIVEALACGLPVAAYPVQGPADILTAPAVGAVHDDLAEAIAMARLTRPEACIELVRRSYSWERSTATLLHHLGTVAIAPRHRPAAAPSATARAHSASEP